MKSKDLAVLVVGYVAYAVFIAFVFGALMGGCVSVQPSVPQCAKPDGGLRPPMGLEDACVCRDLVEGKEVLRVVSCEGNNG